jgi:hypothetical protein
VQLLVAERTGESGQPDEVRLEIDRQPVQPSGSRNRNAGTRFGRIHAA